MKIDVGEGTRGTGGGAEDLRGGAGGGGYGIARSADPADSGSNRAVVQASEGSGIGEEGRRGAEGVGATVLSCVPGVEAGGGGGGVPHSNKHRPLADVALAVVHGRGNSTDRASGEYQHLPQEADKTTTAAATTTTTSAPTATTTATTATSNLAHLGLKRSKLAPQEERVPDGAGTPPTDAGGDPCPSCASFTRVSSPAVAPDACPPCRCSRALAGDMAPGGYTGGEPVASADAVAVDPGGGGSGGADFRGGGGRRGAREGVMVAPEARMRGGGGSRGGGGGRGGGVPSAAVAMAQEAVAAGLLETVALQQQQLRQLQLQQQQQQRQQERESRKRLDLRQGSPISAQQAAAAADGAGMMVVDVGATSCPEGATGGVGATQQATPARTDCCKADTEKQEVGVSQEDTMDRLAQSLAQAEKLAISVEARQTELLARPKRRSHPSAKQEKAAQSRKVRPKSMPQSKSPKLEELGIKVEPGTTAASATNSTPVPSAATATATAASATAAAAAASLMPKQRLLIKIPRSAVTAATAHAAEVAAAAAAAEAAEAALAVRAAATAVVKEEATTDVRVSKRGKGKSGVKRARPLAGTRTSPPPPPPPAPTSRQELPPGCGPPCPSLTGIFGREMDEEELERAVDGAEHLQTSQASRRLTALSAAKPTELASHVQALRLDYLVQKVRPILTKLMSAGTGPQRGLFNVPVDPVKLGIPDYFKRVLHPMDLGTIKSRLLSMTYTTPEAFASDVRLVFNNAISFNPESHFVHTWAVQLLNEFDQEYSKQIGKLDEGWAKSLSHSCQLCQGQTCALCGDKCLKLEPPVIICHHCNKRVVRGGVYHITRDGCRLWCSRCHPGLPPELPTDGDPEGIGAEDADGAVTAVGGNGSASVDGAGSEAGGAGDGAAPTGAGESPQTPPGGSSGGGGGSCGSGGDDGGGGGGRVDQVVASSAATLTAAASSVSSASDTLSLLPPPPPLAPESAAGETVTASVTAVGQPLRASSPPAVAPAVGGGGVTGGGGGAGDGRTGDVSGEAPAAAGATGAAATVAAATATTTSSETGSPGEREVVAGTLGTEGGAVVGGEEAEAVEEVKAPLKRDLLRRKFDEEISEPWVQCDRCNRWVHQVCALFNARANVGEARFVCPLCRLRTVVTKSVIWGASETAAEDAAKPRKRPKSIDGTGKLLSPCPVKPEGPSAAAGVAPVTTVARPGATASLASPVETEQAGAGNTEEGARRASPCGSGGGGRVSPMEGVVISSTPTQAAVAEAGTPAAATAAAVVSPRAMPSLEQPAAPPDCSPLAQAQHTSSSSDSVVPSHGSRPDAVAPGAEGGALVSAGVNSEGGVGGGDGGGGGSGEVGAGDGDGAPRGSGERGCNGAVGSNSGVEVSSTPSVAAAQGKAGIVGAATAEVAAAPTAAARLAATTVASSTAAAVAAVAAVAAAKRGVVADVGVPDSMEVEEDVGAEAAGDASSGSAASDSFDVYAASSLPHTPLSRYIEWRVRQRLTTLENEKAAATLSIRLISNVEATCEVHAVLRETFCCKDGHGVGPNKNDVPELLKYRSKALSMFQRVDGVEVCLFSMYVQEYGADAPYFNARRAYISYLDSVEYFRPRKHRTAVYHEILVAYLDWIRRRGFKAAHIWSCPPQRGNNFIFWCHPLHQKTPTRDRLSGWYGNMLKRAVHLGVAAKVTTLDKTHFAEVERIGILLKNRRTSAAASAAASLAGVKGPDDLPLRPEVPVIFEGDFWAEEAVRLARAVDRRDDGVEESQSPLELCRQALEELLRHQQGAPFAAPVDPARDRCPDYLVVIEQPMDLGTVAETLDAMKYHDAGAFVADVRLIFDNARRYNPPKHPIHVAACKLSKVFDKTVRALESAVNRLPGMHEMGLEHLLLEEPIPPAPATPTSSATVAPGAAGAGAGAAGGGPPRPTAPGKRSIPWAYDAIGPLSQLARQTWAAHNARSARTVGTLPSMREGSPVEVGLPASVPLFRSSNSGFGGAAETSGDYGSSAPGVERLSRSGSTSVMSVSEFYGPSGARMLQRRESTASHVSLADSYGEGEAMESASVARDESREGTAALALLMADDAAVDGGEQPQPQQCDAAGVPVGGGVGVGGCERKGASKEARPQTPQPSPRAATPEATGSRANSPCPPLSWPGQGQAVGTAAAAAGGVGGEASGEGASQGASPPGSAADAAPAAAGTPSPAGGAKQTAEGERGEKAQAGGSSPQTAEAAGAAAAATTGAALGAAVVAAKGAKGAAPHNASPASPSPGGGAQGDLGGVRTLLPPPPLTLESPHPCARANGSASAPSAKVGLWRRPDGALGVNGGRGDGGGNGSPASSMSLTWGAAASALPLESLGDGAQKQNEKQKQKHNPNQRVGLPRAMNVDSAPASAGVLPRSLSVGTQGLGGGAGGLSGSEAFEITASASGGGGGGGAGSGVNGSGSSVGRTAGGALHSPRLRAKSMDSGGRKGKSKRGKGPGSAVMGKADRIGRMLQALSRAVTRISKDLLVVTLGKPDQPAKPPPARSGSGTTTEAMLKELQAWHASSGLEGVLTPDCHDPDPPISRALVDARHTFLEMCQFRHYQFDTLRRAKHSSAMVLYHLHRPESRSLNPFCSRCHRPVRFVRYHCGVCNYDLCAECDKDVGTKCEDGHPLTPYRVTFSTEDAEKSPAAGFTPATGGTSLSPLRSSGGARSDTAAAAAGAGAGAAATAATAVAGAGGGAGAAAAAGAGAEVALAVDGGGGGGGGGGANATEAPGDLLSGNGGGGRQQQQPQAPRMRDSRGGPEESGVGRGGGGGGGGGVVVAMDENRGSVGAAANPAGLGRLSAPSTLPSPSLSPSNSPAEGVLRETERRTREAEGRGTPGSLAQRVRDGGCAAMPTAPGVDVGGREGQTAAVAVVAVAAAGAAEGGGRA